MGEFFIAARPEGEGTVLIDMVGSNPTAAAIFVLLIFENNKENKKENNIPVVRIITRFGGTYDVYDLNLMKDYLKLIISVIKDEFYNDSSPFIILILAVVWILFIYCLIICHADIYV